MLLTTQNTSQNAYASSGSLQGTRNTTSAADGSQSAGINVTSGQVDTYSPGVNANEAGVYNPRMFTQNANGHRTVDIKTSDGGTTGYTNTANGVKTTGLKFSDLSPTRQREEFSKRMGEAGIQASNPPTEAELKKYFATFNTKEKRAQATAQFEDYASAYHIHSDNADTKSGDVQYSKETNYAVGKKYFTDEKKADAESARTGKTITDINTYDASSWNDVASRPTNPSDGRKVQDCEGYSYMAGELLGAAGYKPTQVATGGDAHGHAMTVLKDPNGGNSVVVSNGNTFSGPANTQDALLKKGWESTDAGKTNASGPFYTGATQAEAQGRQAAATNE